MPVSETGAPSAPSPVRRRSVLFAQGGVWVVDWDANALQPIPEGPRGYRLAPTVVASSLPRHSAARAACAGSGWVRFQSS